MTEESIPVEISVQAVRDSLANGAITLIDCREAAEWDIAKIEGAVLLPMSTWQAEAPGKLAELSDQPIVVHCHHGGRSLQVTCWLRENGFPSAQNMTGGIDVWSQEVDPEVPRY